MPPPQRLTDYIYVDVEVHRVAGGGFGRVFMGPNRGNGGRWSALKTLRPELLAVSSRARELFVREALIWCGLWPHANLLTAQSVAEINGQPYLVLDYAEYGSLRDLLRQRAEPLPVNVGLTWAQHIAAGLVVLQTPDPAWLRPEPLVHRDLKPENVLLEEHGLAMITDFGLARAVQEDAEVLALLATLGDEGQGQVAGRSRALRTGRGLALGTPAYMAPEQWQDADSAGPPADMYAFGLILSELLAGRHALLDLAAGHDVDSWRAAHRDPAPRPLREVAPQVPEAVEVLYRALLAPVPEARPAAGEALAVLQEAEAALGRQPYTAPEVIDHTPDHERMRWHTLAIAYSRFGRHKEAFERNIRALALDLHNPNTLITQGAIVAKLGRLEEALAAYDAALAALPEEDLSRRAAAWNQRGVVLNEATQYAQAEAAYTQTLALLPDYADAWYNRANNARLWGLAEAEPGRMAQAREHYAHGLDCIRRAIAIDPDDSVYRDLQAALRKQLARLGG